MTPEDYRIKRAPWPKYLCCPKCGGWCGGRTLQAWPVICLQCSTVFASLGDLAVKA